MSGAFAAGILADQFTSDNKNLNFESWQFASILCASLLLLCLFSASIDWRLMIKARTRD